MPVRTRMATEADLPRVAEISSAAFDPSTDAIARNFFPARLQPNGVLEPGFQTPWRYARKITQFNDPETVIMVAVEDGAGGEEGIIGYTVWSAPHDGDGPPRPPPPPTLDLEALKTAMDIINVGAKEILGEKGTKGTWCE
jgi:hypothetical protein